MSCRFTVTGKKFDVDSFLDQAKFRDVHVRYKGQPRFKTKPDGEKLPYSYFSMLASKAEFSEPKKQVADATRFLKRHYEKLTLLKSTKNIDFATLDFGIALRIASGNGMYQSDFFPASLIRLAGELGIGIEVSIYAVGS